MIYTLDGRHSTVLLIKNMNSVLPYKIISKKLTHTGHWQNDFFGRISTPDSLKP